jgi:predicted MPP superfamily phosphohydrolase
MHGDELRELIGRRGRNPGSAGIKKLEPVRERRGPWLQLRVPHGFEWNRYELAVDGLRPELDGFRIVHLSDLHFKSFWSRTYELLLGRVNRARADLILISGDFVDNKTKGVAETPYVMRLVEALRARAGVYGILGNHDGDLVGAYLPKCGVRLLDNERAEPVPGIEVVGSTAVSREDFDRDAMRSLPPKPPGGVRIVMTHYPDTLLRLGEFHPDVVLAGHTHGGQVCLPGGYPIISHDHLPRDLSRGVHRIAGTWLVVSRGLGYASLPVRVFCPAEVIELVLRPA